MGRDKLTTIVSAIAGAAIIIAIMVGSVVSNYHRHTDEPQAQPAEAIEQGLPQRAVGGPPDQGSSNQTKSDEPDQPDWVAITGLLVSFGGVLLVAATFYLQRVAAIGDQRAYVKIDIANVSIKPGEAVAVAFSPKNYGKTPARKMAVCSTLFIRAKAWSWETGGLPPLEWFQKSVDLHPGDDREMPAFVRKADGSLVILGEPLFRLIETGESCLFVRVAVRYRDTFRKWRETEMRWEMSGADAIHHSKGQLIMCRVT